MLACTSERDLQHMQKRPTIQVKEMYYTSKRALLHKERELLYK